MPIGQIIPMYAGMFFGLVYLVVTVYVLYVFVTTCNAVKRYMNYKNAEYEKQINDKYRDDLKRELEELKRKE